MGGPRVYSIDVENLEPVLLWGRTDHTATLFGPSYGRDARRARAAALRGPLGAFFRRAARDLRGGARGAHTRPYFIPDATTPANPPC